MNRPSMPPKTHEPVGRRKWLAHPWLSLVLAVSWLLMQGAISVVNLAWAAIVAVVLPWLLHGFIGPGSQPRRVGVMLSLVATVLWDIVVSNVTVARIVLTPGYEPRPAWLRVRHSLEDPRAVMLLATIITTTPGTVSCVVDEGRREILVHALDVTDPDGVVATILQRYERPLKEIFG
jgi:multicomponent K+:H+ antiporter subunit E